MTKYITLTEADRKALGWLVGFACTANELLSEEGKQRRDQAVQAAQALLERGAA